MTDSIKQIGKNIKQISENSKNALNRYAKKLPAVEKIRDIFDSRIAFNHKFKVPSTTQRVKLSLNFSPPPPSGCCGDCFCTACETFRDGNEAIQLQYPYISGSVNVFINNNRTTNFSQTDPDAGIITLGTSVTANVDEVKVCYVYNYADCSGTEVPPPEDCCGITDSFENRLVTGGGWDKSDSGIYWIADLGDPILGGEASVQDGYGRLYNEYSGFGRAFPSMTLPSLPIETTTSTFDIAFQLRFSYDNSSFQYCWVQFKSSTGPATHYNYIFFGLGSSTLELGYFNTGTGFVGVFDSFTHGEDVWYNIRWQQTDDEMQRMKIWLDGEEEPESWFLEHSVPLFVWVDDPDFYMEIDHGGESEDVPVEVHIKNLDVSGVNLCSNFMVDTFSREITGELGISSGYITDGGARYWFPIFPTIPHAGTEVDNGIGTISLTTPTAGVFNTLIRRYVLIGSWTAYGYTYDVGSDFRLVLRFRPIFSVNANSRTLTIFHGDNSSGDFEAQVCAVSIQYGASEKELEITSPTAGGLVENNVSLLEGQWTTIIWEHSSSTGVARAKIWNDEIDSEPDWINIGSAATIEEFASSGIEVSCLGLDMSTTASNPFTVEIDYINIDNVEHPCGDEESEFTPPLPALA